MRIYVIPATRTAPSMRIYVIPATRTAPSMRIYVIPATCTAPSMRIYMTFVYNKPHLSKKWPVLLPQRRVAFNKTQFLTNLAKNDASGTWWRARLEW